jgi:hypothetical protein
MPSSRPSVSNRPPPLPPSAKPLDVSSTAPPSCGCVVAIRPGAKEGFDPAGVAVVEGLFARPDRRGFPQRRDPQRHRCGAQQAQILVHVSLLAEDRIDQRALGDFDAYSLSRHVAVGDDLVLGYHDAGAEIALARRGRDAHLHDTGRQTGVEGRAEFGRSAAGNRRRRAENERDRRQDGSCGDPGSTAVGWTSRSGNVGGDEKFCRPRCTTRQFQSVPVALSGHEEGATGDMVQRAQTIVVRAEMPAAVAEHAAVSLSRDHFADEQVVAALVVRFRHDAAFEPGNAAGDQRCRGCSASNAARCRARRTCRVRGPTRCRPQRSARAAPASVH